VIASYPGFPTQATHSRYPLCVCFITPRTFVLLQRRLQQGGDFDGWKTEKDNRKP